MLRTIWTYLDKETLKHRDLLLDNYKIRCTEETEFLWDYETYATCAASESAQALTSECPGAKCVP